MLFKTFDHTKLFYKTMMTNRLTTNRIPNNLNRRVLEVMEDSVGCKYAVSLRQTSEGFWTISLKFDGKDDVHGIETVRGGQKVWRDLEKTIHYVQETCKAAESVSIEVGGWTLVRSTGA